MQRVNETNDMSEKWNKNKDDDYEWGIGKEISWERGKCWIEWKEMENNKRNEKWYLMKKKC